MVIDSCREWLGIQWVKVTLYFHLREKIAKRLHHKLSDTILTSENSKMFDHFYIWGPADVRHCLFFAKSKHIIHICRRHLNTSLICPRIIMVSHVISTSVLTSPQYFTNYDSHIYSTLPLKCINIVQVLSWNLQYVTLMCKRWEKSKIVHQ